MMTYQDQIKHPLWQKKRLEVMEMHGFKCEKCGDKEEQLNVHHPFYERGLMLWEYKAEWLKCFCQRCHKNEHAIDESIHRYIALSSPEFKLFLVGMLAAAARNPMINSDDRNVLLGAKLAEDNGIKLSEERFLG